MSGTPDLPQQSLHLLLHLAASVNAKVAEQASSWGMTVAQVSIIQDVGAHPKTTLQEICDRLQLPKSSVSWAVDDLVQKGMLERVTPPDNRRSVHISIPQSHECPAFDWKLIFSGAPADANSPDWDSLKKALATITQVVEG